MHTYVGTVAFVVGGFGEHPPNNLVEVFSPDGGCQHHLERISTNFNLLPKYFRTKL
jgi:hypothetical protein